MSIFYYNKSEDSYDAHKSRKKTKHEKEYELYAKVMKSRKRLESLRLDLAEKGPGVLYFPNTLKELELITQDLKEAENAMNDLNIGF